MATFVFIIHEGVRTNFFRFSVIYIVFVLAFSQSFYIAFDYGRNLKNFNSPLRSFYDVFLMNLHDIGDFYVYITQSKQAIVGRILFVTFLVLVPMLLINLLIAMMTHTYMKTTKLKREWLRQWSKQVLMIEQNMTRGERLKRQKKYANVIETGEKVFIVKWKQSVYILILCFSFYTFYQYFDFKIYFRIKRETK